MSVFTSRQSSAIRRAIDHFGARMCNLYHFSVEPMEILEAFVQPEDIAVLKRAQALGLRSSGYSSGCTLKLRADGDQVPEDTTVDINLSSLRLPIPDLISSRTAMTPPDTLPCLPKLREYIGNVYNLSVSFAQARAVFEMLDERCATPKQVRYFLPAILPLLVQADLREMAEKLSGSSALRSPPILPPGARQLLIDTNNLIAKAVLMPDRPRPPTNVLLRWENNIALPWGDSARPMPF